MTQPKGTAIRPLCQSPPAAGRVDWLLDKLEPGLLQLPPDRQHRPALRRKRPEERVFQRIQQVRLRVDFGSFARLPLVRAGPRTRAAAASVSALIVFISLFMLLFVSFYVINSSNQMQLSCLSFSRVSGGNFTLTSHGTVLDSLPSHGSSHLTLLFY